MFPLKKGDLIKLTGEWYRYAQDGEITDSIRDQLFEVYKVKHINQIDDDVWNVWMYSTKGVDPVGERCVELNENLVCVTSRKWGHMPMFTLAHASSNVSSTARCLICGQQAFCMFFTVECSNPNCQNFKQ